MSRMGRFIERICKGAFQRALRRNDNIRILLNHDWNRDLGGTKDGNLELCEDAIGLRVRATITDKEVVDKAKRGDLVGWSFGFTDVDVKAEVAFLLQKIDNRLTEVMDVDGDIVKSCRCHTLNDVLQQGFAGNLYHRLGTVVSQRAQACT